MSDWATPLHQEEEKPLSTDWAQTGILLKI